MVLLRNKSCEKMIHHTGHKPKIMMYNWKRLHFGLFKVWLGYEYYCLCDNKGCIVKNEDGLTPSGKHLKQIDINWTWKKKQKK